MRIKEDDVHKALSIERGTDHLISATYPIIAILKLLGVFIPLLILLVTSIVDTSNPHASSASVSSFENEGLR